MFRTFQKLEVSAWITACLTVVILLTQGRWVTLMVGGAIVLMVLAGIKRYLVDSYDAGYRAGMRAVRRDRSLQ